MSPPQKSKPEVVCAGLACVDIELASCNVPSTLEAITPYSHTRYAVGGCAPQTAKALAALSLSTAAVYPAAADAHGGTLFTLLEATGVYPYPVAVDDHPTALAILPVFVDGRRGCYVSLGANMVVPPAALAPTALIHENLRGFHCGYPHLLPLIQGEALRGLLDRVRAAAPSVIISLDVNGAEKQEDDAAVLSPALPAVDLLHANLEEACVISGLGDATLADTYKGSDIKRIVRWFGNVATSGVRTPCPSSRSITIGVTCGKKGVFLGRAVEGSETQIIHREAFSLLENGDVNASGAGDSFAAGALAGLLLPDSDLLSTSDEVLEQVADAGLSSALNTIDAGHRMEHASIPKLLTALRDRPRIHSGFEV